jgi:hypothetical protein
MSDHEAPSGAESAPGDVLASRNVKLGAAVVLGLLLAAGIVAAVAVLGDGPAASPESSPPPGEDHVGMSGDERCEHMPEHCETGGNT